MVHNLQKNHNFTKYIIPCPLVRLCQQIAWWGGCIY